MKDSCSLGRATQWIAAGLDAKLIPVLPHSPSVLLILLSELCSLIVVSGWQGHRYPGRNHWAPFFRLPHHHTPYPLNGPASICVRISTNKDLLFLECQIITAESNSSQHHSKENYIDIHWPNLKQQAHQPTVIASTVKLTGSRSPGGMRVRESEPGACRCHNSRS